MREKHAPTPQSPLKLNQIYKQVALSLMEDLINGETDTEETEASGGN